MAILKTPNGWNLHQSTSSTNFVGRVLKVETVTESRNWSDTLDYTDIRTTQCTWALVWLGTNFVPPRNNNSTRPSTYYMDGEALPDYAASDVRDLEFFEQFAWVDCTNLHSDRCGFSLSPEADASATGGDPLMWANFIAWEAFHKAAAAKRIAANEAAAAARAEEARKEAEKREARAAKAAAKDAVGEAAAKQLLAAVPPKGTAVTVDGFTGKITWTGAKKFRGKWQARVGIKNARGEMAWVDAAKVCN